MTAFCPLVQKQMHEGDVMNILHTQAKSAPDCTIWRNSLSTAGGSTRRMQASMRVLKVSTVGITPALPISFNMPKASCTSPTCRDTTGCNTQWLLPRWVPIAVGLSRHPCIMSQPAEKKRKDYAFWRQFNEKRSVIPGCPGQSRLRMSSTGSMHVLQMLAAMLAAANSAVITKSGLAQLDSAVQSNQAVPSFIQLHSYHNTHVYNNITVRHWHHAAYR